MSCEVGSKINDSYRLIQSAFAYNGECEICKIGNKDIFSLHQVPIREYNKVEDGEVVQKGHLQGIIKDVQIILSSGEKTDIVTRPVFHQVAQTTSNKMHLFTPMHAACPECINLMKKTAPLKCHICRFEIAKTQKLHTNGLIARNNTSNTSLTISQRSSYILRSKNRRTLEDESAFSNMGRSQRKRLAKQYTENIELLRIYDEFEEFFEEESCPTQIDYTNMDYDTRNLIEHIVAEDGHSDESFLQEQVQAIRGDEESLSYEQIKRENQLDFNILLQTSKSKRNKNKNISNVK